MKRWSVEPFEDERYKFKVSYIAYSREVHAAQLVENDDRDSLAWTLRQMRRSCDEYRSAKAKGWVK